jgi:hypothetical protein
MWPAAQSPSPNGSTRTPNVFTNYVGSAPITYDAKGNPVQASLKLGGLPQSSGYKLCIDIVPETKPSSPLVRSPCPAPRSGSGGGEKSCAMVIFR